MLPMKHSLIKFLQYLRRFTKIFVPTTTIFTISTNIKILQSSFGFHNSDLKNPPSILTRIPILTTLIIVLLKWFLLVNATTTTTTLIERLIPKDPQKQFCEKFYREMTANYLPRRKGSEVDDDSSINYN